MDSLPREKGLLQVLCGSWGQNGGCRKSYNVCGRGASSLVCCAVILMLTMALQEREAEVEKDSVLFGITLGTTALDEDTQEHGFGTRFACMRDPSLLVFPVFNLHTFLRYSTRRTKSVLFAPSTLNPVSNSWVSRTVLSLPSKIMFDTRPSSTLTTQCVT
jgi:hypothetical protein